MDNGLMYSFGEARMSDFWLLANIRAVEFTKCFLKSESPMTNPKVSFSPDDFD